MEKLKLLKDILEPDVRQKYFSRINFRTGEAKEKTLEDIYYDVECVTLSCKVPQAISDHFETAKNLFVYSWFVYPFNVVAELQAYSSLEFAIREKTGDRKTAFSRLLKKIVDDGWLTDSDLSFNPLRKEGTINSKSETQPESLQQSRDYCNILCETIPKLRNDLAHGSSTLHNNGLLALRICADLINQLYK